MTIRRFNKIIIAFATISLSIFILTGCDNLLEGSVESITAHQAAPFVRPPVEQTTVSDYDEFLNEIIALITLHETSGQILYYSRDGEDVQAEMERAVNEIKNNHPLGAFAVVDIIANATRIVTHYEVDIEIEYKRTKEQMDSIINVSAELGVMNNLLDIMSQYKDEAFLRSRLQLSEEDITEIVKEIYYRNPRRVVMLPIVTLEVFPEHGTDRIHIIQFGYSESSSVLQRFGELLEIYVQRNAELAEGNTESEILLSLINSLIESTIFDEGAARTIHVHGAQNLAATAYGALVRGSAVGEGFAMAFKALADELGFDCRVVLGYHDGQVHAWNIISLYGDFYHVDAAMSRVNGIETAFLKTDADFEEMLYTWDMENTVRCEGELTLDDIQGLGETDEPDEGDESEGNDEPNSENNGEEN